MRNVYFVVLLFKNLDLQFVNNFKIFFLNILFLLWQEKEGIQLWGRKWGESGWMGGERSLPVSAKRGSNMTAVQVLIFPLFPLSLSPSLSLSLSVSHFYSFLFPIFSFLFYPAPPSSFYFPLWASATSTNFIFDAIFKFYLVFLNLPDLQPFAPPTNLLCTPDHTQPRDEQHWMTRFD